MVFVVMSLCMFSFLACYAFLSISCVLHLSIECRVMDNLSVLHTAVIGTAWEAESLAISLPNPCELKSLLDSGRHSQTSNTL